ncbi:MAG: redoxin domain-containing protein [Cellvibrionaceae bacterium]
MKNKQQNLSIFILLISSLFFSCAVTAGKFNTIINIGDSLPEFENLLGTDKKLYSSKDISEDFIVLVSLSNMCPFSNGIENDLIKLADELKNQSVKFIAVNYNMNKGDNMIAMQQRDKQYNYNFIYLKDDEQNLGRQLGTTVTPEFFVFDKNRKLIYMGLLHNSPAMAQRDKSVYLKGEPTDFYVRDAIIATTNNTIIEPSETRAYGCSVEYLSALDPNQK